MHYWHLLPKRDVSSIMLYYEFRVHRFYDSKFNLISKVLCNITCYIIIRVEK